MTQDNLLNVEPDQVQIDENKDWHTELVGEGRKYKDDKALALSRVHADRHIAFVEGENAEMREEILRLKQEVNAGAKLQELLDKIDTQQQLTSREPTPNSNEEMKPALKLDEVESLVSSKIQQHEQQRKEQDNFNQVKAKLTERFGSNFKDALKDKSDALGLSDEEVNTMARKNPNLFIKTFDLNVQGETFQTPPRTSGVFAPKLPQKRNWAYYQDLKKKTGAWDKATRLQMEKDAQALGEAFYEN